MRPLFIETIMHPDANLFPLLISDLELPLSYLFGGWTDAVDFVNSTGEGTSGSRSTDTGKV